MSAINDITGDKIKTRPTILCDDKWNTIFPRKTAKQWFTEVVGVKNTDFINGLDDHSLISKTDFQKMLNESLASEIIKSPVNCNDGLFSSSMIKDNSLFINN